MGFLSWFRCVAAHKAAMNINRDDYDDDDDTDDSGTDGEERGRKGERKKYKQKQKCVLYERHHKHMEHKRERKRNQRRQQKQLNKEYDEKPEQYYDTHSKIVEFSGIGGEHYKGNLDFAKPIPLKRKLIIFLEGTSGVGKTTLADYSLDFFYFIEKWPQYASKQANVYLQCVYDIHLFTLTFQNLHRVSVGEEFSEKSVIYHDRSFISQFVYAILFTFNGQYADPVEFRSSVYQAIFGDINMCDIFRSSAKSMISMLERFENVDVQIKWCITNDVDFTAECLRARNTLEHQMGWNLNNYLLNQNFLFENMYKLLGIGDLIYVTTFVSNTEIGNKN